MNETTEAEVDVADIEDYTARKKPLPPAKRYGLKIDGKRYEVTTRRISGKDILLLAGKSPPERFQLDKRIRGKFVQVGLTEIIDLGEPGLEVFETFPLDEREG
jgi:hypothetical protein